MESYTKSLNSLANGKKDTQLSINLVSFHIETKTMKTQASKYKEVLSDIFGLGSMSLKNCRNRNNLLSKRTRKNNFIGNTPILK